MLLRIKNLTVKSKGRFVISIICVFLLFLISAFLCQRVFFINDDENIMYTIAGGQMYFKYGNAMTDLNHVPSSMPMTQSGGDLNNYVDKGWGIAYGRPIKRSNIGYIHGLGLSADAGLEFFLAENISLSAALNFTPVMVTFQPQTYSVFEGFSTKTGRVEQVNGLVSPGSNSLLYGTQNIGCRISLTYYL